MGDTSRQELVALGRKKLEEFRQRRRQEALALQVKEEGTPELPHLESDSASIGKSDVGFETKDFAGPKEAANEQQASLDSTESCLSVQESDGEDYRHSSPRTSSLDAGKNLDHEVFDREIVKDLGIAETGGSDEGDGSSSAEVVHERSQFNAGLFLVPRDDEARINDSVCTGVGDGASLEERLKEDSTGVDDEDNKNGMLSEKRKNFERLQEHIDALTSEKMDLSLCLQQQTNLVRRLTEENETMVKRLNDAASKAEHLQGLILNMEREKKAIEARLVSAERELNIKEKENRNLTAKVKVLGGELVNLEENLFHVKEKMNSESAHGIDRRGKESRIVEYQNENAELRSKVGALQGTLEKLQQSLKESESQRATLEAEGALAREKEIIKMEEIERSNPLTWSIVSRTISKSGSAYKGTIPVEIQALLPNRSCLLRNKFSKDDIELISKRIYVLLDDDAKD